MRYMFSIKYNIVWRALRKSKLEQMATIPYRSEVTKAVRRLQRCHSRL